MPPSCISLNAIPEELLTDEVVIPVSVIAPIKQVKNGSARHETFAPDEFEVPFILTVICL